MSDLEKTPPSPAIAGLWPGYNGPTVGDAGALNTFPRFDTGFAGSSSQPMLAQSRSPTATSSAGPNPFGRLGIFVNGTFGFGDKDTTSREAGFDFDTYGVTSGIDYRFTDNFVLGLAFGYHRHWALGGQASYAISTGFGVLVPQVRFEWEHEFLDNQRTITTRFVSDPANTPVLLETDNPDHDYFNFGAGLSAVFQRGMSAFVYYETVLALRDVTAHQIAVGTG